MFILNLFFSPFIPERRTFFCCTLILRYGFLVGCAYILFFNFEFHAFVKLEARVDAVVKLCLDVIKMMR